MGTSNSKNSDSGTVWKRNLQHDAFLPALALVTTFDADSIRRIIQLSHVCQIWRNALVQSDVPVLAQMWHHLVTHSPPAMLRRVPSTISRCNQQQQQQHDEGRTPPRSPTNGGMGWSSTAHPCEVAQEQQQEHHPSPSRAGSGQQQPAPFALEQLTHQTCRGSCGSNGLLSLGFPTNFRARSNSCSSGISSHGVVTPTSGEGLQQAPQLTPSSKALEQAHHEAQHQRERKHKNTPSSSVPAAGERRSSVNSNSQLLDVPHGAAAAETELVSGGFAITEEFVHFASVGGPLWAIEHLVFKGGKKQLGGREHNKVFLNGKSIKSGNTALIEACKSNRLNVVPTLLKGGCGINRHGSHGTTALLEAVRGSQTLLVKYLLDHGAEPSTDAVGNVPLAEAVKSDPTGAVLQILLASGKFEPDYVKPSKEKKDREKQHHDNEQQQKQKQQGNDKASTGAPPAQFAAEKPPHSLLEPHLKNIPGASSSSSRAADRAVNAPTPPPDAKAQALLVAATRGFQRPIELLLKNGADANAADPATRLTALHLAIKAAHVSSSIEIVDLLIRHGANVDAMSTTHISPLMQAAVVGDPDVAEKLIAAKAKLNVRDIAGDSAIALAKKHGNDNIVELLRKHDVME